MMMKKRYLCIYC